MTSQWFYIQQWKQQSWERLLEYRTIRVQWDCDEKDQRKILPQFVKLPVEVELTNEGICAYLSNKFGHCVHDWTVATGDIDET